MVFSSILFLFRFLPVAFAIYYLMPSKLKNAALVVLSLIFYSWGEVKYLPIMIASVLVDYMASNIIENNRDNKNMCKVALVISVFFNLGMLFFFKYTNFFIDNFNFFTGSSFEHLDIALPLGISFYTFQTMSYTIDVYRNKVQAEKSIVDFAAFVVLFPQLIAGPIVKYIDINKELKERKINFEQIQNGISLFILGLGSKVLIANNVGALWNEVEQLGFKNISTPLAWLGIIAFSLQIYFDFSGYSLMAIGLGKMLGFEFPKNFDYPYTSKSFTEFWRRWHMTLGSWFREYLYIPLGGNRVGSGRRYFNLFVVWAATGFWHGASWNFVLWGLLFFVLISIERAFLLQHLEKSNVISRIYLIFLLLLSWSLFAITDFAQLSVFFSKLFIFKNGTDWLYYLRNYAAIIFLGCILSTPLLKILCEKYIKLNFVKNAFLILLFIISVAYLVDSTYNPFLYFRF